MLGKAMARGGVCYYLAALLWRHQRTGSWQEGTQQRHWPVGLAEVHP